MSIDYKDLFEYRDGNLYWKAKTHPSVRIEIGDKVGGLDVYGYVVLKAYGKAKKAHRVIWEMFNGPIPKGMEIDHINNNRNDNHIENLQLVSSVKNQQRRFDRKGYSFRLGRYEAARNYNNKKHYLGVFGTACGAYMAYKTFFIGRSYV